MSTIEQIELLNTPLKRSHRLVIEGDYQSMAGMIRDFDNRYLRTETPPAIVLANGKSTLWSMQGHPARSFEKPAELMKMRDFLLEFEFSASLLPEHHFWTYDKYQLCLEKGVGLDSSSYLRVGLTSSSIIVDMCFDKLYVLSDLGRSGELAFAEPCVVPIPVDMMTVGDIHKVAIQVAFGKQVLYNGLINEAINEEGTVFGLLAVFFDGVEYFKQGLVAISDTNPSVPYQLIMNMSEYRNSALFVENVRFSNVASPVKSELRFYSLRIAQIGGVEMIGGQPFDFFDELGDVKKWDGLPRNNVLAPLLSQSVAEVSIDRGVYYLHLGYGFDPQSVACKTLLTVQSTVGGNSVDVHYDSSSDLSGVGLYLDLRNVDSIKLKNLSFVVGSHDPGYTPQLPYIRNLCFMQKVGFWANFEGVGLTPVSWNSFDYRKLVFESSNLLPIVEGLADCEEFVIPFSMVVEGDVYTYYAPLLGHLNLIPISIVSVGGRSVRGRIRVYNGSVMLINQSYVYNGRYHSLNFNSVSDEGIFVTLSEFRSISLDDLPRLYLVVRQLWNNEEPELFELIL